MTPAEHIAEARLLLSAAADRLQVAFDHPDARPAHRNAATSARMLIGQAQDELAPVAVTR